MPLVRRPTYINSVKSPKGTDYKILGKNHEDLFELKEHEHGEVTPINRSKFKRNSCLGLDYKYGLKNK